MAVYQVVVSAAAAKNLEKLPVPVVGRIVTALQGLEQNPRPAGCKKLKGFDNLWRIRVGDYRVLYAIEEQILLVDVRAAGHRKDIYG